MKKLLTIMTAFVLALAVAMPVMAADNQYATVTDITNDDTKKGDVKSTVVGSGTSETTVTFSSASVKTLEAGDETGATKGRPAGYAWLGVRLDIPKAENNQEITELKVNGETVTPVENPLDLYTGIKKSTLEEKAKNGETQYVETYNVTWKQGETEVAQTIKVVVELAGVTLYEGNSDTPVWNEEIYNEVKPEPVPETNKKPATKKPAKNEKDDSPNTGVENVYAIAGLVAVVTIAGAVVLNKRK